VRTRAVGIRAPGEAALLDVELAEPGAGALRGQTLFSGVSAGTELTFLKGTNPALHASWDAEYGVFRADTPAAAYPVERLGYMEVGRVVESRAREVAEGTVVAMTYGHKEAHVADASASGTCPCPRTWTPCSGSSSPTWGPSAPTGCSTPPPS
jgi:NADPH-dependent curcumin reductase CurA